MTSVFQRDGDGNVIDPPTNPDMERQMTRARDTGDPEYVARVQGEYDEWRASEVERVESAASADANTATDATTAGPTPGAEPASVTHPAPEPLPGESAADYLARTGGDQPAPSAPASDAQPGGGAA